jgi:hypothetical protein
MLRPPLSFSSHYASFEFVRKQDLPAISEAAGLPVQPWLTEGEITLFIDDAFKAAFFEAACAEIEPTHFERKKMAQEISTAARRLLKVLGYSEDTAWFAENGAGKIVTSELNILSSVIALLTRSTTDGPAPLPFRIADQTKDELPIDLRSAMETAKFIQRIERRVSSVTKTEHPDASVSADLSIRVEMMTRFSLLRVTPHLVALLISLCASTEQQPPATDPRKENFSRRFHRAVFRYVVATFPMIFGVDPKESDAEREPGPVTLWMAQILEVAAKNFLRSEAALMRGSRPDQQIWLRELRRGLLQAHRLQPSTKMKRIREARIGKAADYPQYPR